MNQLPAFLTAHEIRSEYKPLPADYEEFEEEKTSDTRGTATHIHDMPRNFKWTGGPQTGKVRERLVATGERGHRMPYTFPQSRTLHETEDELWERKAEEADYSGLTGRLERQGVMNPVQLSTVEANDPESQSHGSKVVLGGHHRVAAMGDVDPHQLMPVLHYDRTTVPRDDPAYPYEGRHPSLHAASTLSQGLAAEESKTRGRARLRSLAHDMF